MPNVATSHQQRISTLLAEAPRELRLETELLIARTLGWSRSRVLAFDEQTLESNQLAALHAQLSRLKNGEPFAYITGEKEFFGLTLKITPDVLVPRPDTELLVELVVDLAPEHARLVDMGTGSGAIAVALKHTRRDLHVTAIDRDQAALAIARHNATAHGCDIQFVRSNWFTKTADHFDVIVSNPPYIASSDPHLPDLVHEPSSALVAGVDGLDDIRQLVRGAPAALNSNGLLLLEHGYDQKTAVQQLFQTAGFCEISTHADMAGNQRVTQGKLTNA